MFYNLFPSATFVLSPALVLYDALPEARTSELFGHRILFSLGYVFHSSFLPQSPRPCMLFSSFHITVVGQRPPYAVAGKGIDAVFNVIGKYV